MAKAAAEHLVVGELGSPHGLRGFNRLRSFTDPAANILEYAPKVFLLRDGQRLQLAQVRPEPNLLARVDGSCDRTAAEGHRGALLYMNPADLPEPQVGEYYWHELAGMEVLQSGTAEPLGRVERLLETGSNDVLVVRGGEGAELLIPWQPGEVVLGVDRSERRLTVDWDAAAASRAGRGASDRKAQP